MSQQAFLIWSIEHDAWWRAGEMGYTRDISEAGVYTEYRAQQIVEQANRYSFNECMIPETCLREREMKRHFVYRDPETGEEIKP